MNEEIKEILGTINNDIENYYVGTNGCLYQDLTKEQLLLIKNYITNLQQKVEQLEKENNEMKEKLNIDLQWAFKCDELFARNKQLENIRKEAIEYNYKLQENYSHGALFEDKIAVNVYKVAEENLNILNKGSEDNE